MYAAKAILKVYKKCNNAASLIRILATTLDFKLKIGCYLSFLSELWERKLSFAVGDRVWLREWPFAQNAVQFVNCSPFACVPELRSQKRFEMHPYSEIFMYMYGTKE